MFDKINNRPTNKDLEVTLDVLEYVLDYLNNEEPYATSTIGALESLIEEFPRDVSEIEYYN